jgi:arginase
MRKLEFIEIPSEIGAGTRGASLGISALKVADQNSEKAFFKTITPKVVTVQNDYLYKSTQTPSALRIEGIAKVYESMAETVKKSIAEGNFPVILAGDHSTAGATIAGLKMANPNRKLGVIWVDAHADLHSPFTSPSGNVHGMPLACSLNEDNLDCKINDPQEKTISHWNSMKNLGGIAPKLQAEDIVFIALRDFEKPENHIIQKNKIKVIDVAECRSAGIDSIISESIEYLSACDDIYISYDVDSIDSSISMGTGTPVANGLNEKELEHLLSGLVAHKKVNCFEITEINPTLDSKNKMAEIAYQILVKCVDVLTS